MCGILFVKKDNINKEKFKSMVESLNHRGPDDSGCVFYNDIGIGHTRLSIIDTSTKARQPMISNCDRYTLSFNGEIYNYQTIKNELINKGYIFNSDSDTEVLLNGYKEFKVDLLDKLDGIFSFVIYDKTKDEVFFARDHFGIKPLYYLYNNNELTICSETRPFNDISSIDNKSKILFLSHGYIPSPYTIFNDVFSLSPGSYAVLSNNQLTIKKYYNIEDSFDSGKEGVKIGTIKKAVKKQLISDAKLGCFLSGGVDSSILAYESNMINKNISSYSINFQDMPDEKIYQESLIKKYKLNNSTVNLDFVDFKKYLSLFLASMDMPTIDGFNTFFVSKLARESKAKVALSGVGSDEIFFGYPIHRNASLIKLLSKFIFLVPRFLLPNKYKKLDYLRLENDYGYYLAQRAVFSIEEISHILNIKESYIIDHLNKSCTINDNYKKLKFINRMAYFEITKYMEGQLLKDTDVFGMKNSLEIRVPFLDKFLVNEALGINPSHKIKGKINKSTLVNMYNKILPISIYKRKKKGFELPYKYWLQNIGIRREILKKYKNLRFSNSTHWSKIWALYILEQKY